MQFSGSFWLELDSVVAEVGATSEEEAGTTSEEDVGGTSELEFWTVSALGLTLEVGASMLLGTGESWLVPLDAGASLSLLVGVALPLDAGVSLPLESGSWTELVSLTGDTLELSSPQAVNAKAIIEAAAIPQAMLVIFFFMILLLNFYMALPPQSWSGGHCTHDELFPQGSSSSTSRTGLTLPLKSYFR
jgi:hypothetical protein